MYDIDSVGIESFINDNLLKKDVVDGVCTMLISKTSDFSEEQHAQHFANFVATKKNMKYEAKPICERSGCASSNRYYIGKQGFGGIDDADFLFVLYNNQIFYIKDLKGSIDLIIEYTLNFP